MSKLKFTFKVWPVITLVTIGLSLLTQLVAKGFGIELAEQPVLEMLKKMAGWNAPFLTNVAYILLGAPITEELLFRSLLFRLPALGSAWRARSSRYLAAMIGSSAVFAFVHYLDFAAISAGRGFGLLPLNNAFLALGFFGMAQCWLYRRTETIFSPMVSHFFFNLTNLVLLFVV